MINRCARSRFPECPPPEMVRILMFLVYILWLYNRWLVSLILRLLSMLNRSGKIALSFLYRRPSFQFSPFRIRIRRNPKKCFERKPIVFQSLFVPVFTQCIIEPRIIYISLLQSLLEVKFQIVITPFFGSECYWIAQWISLQNNGPLRIPSPNPLSTSSDFGEKCNISST